VSGAVQAQYEAYPYPPRDPADEAKRLITGTPSHMAEINHYCFAGRRDWRRPFRALFAGGGTGDGLIMLAQQLADAGAAAELHYLDLSAPSRFVAEARARARGLKDIRFVTGSLLEVGRLAPGPYDYIDCCGVLHHLDDPPAGMAALARQLKPAGAMGAMLYGQLGRTGVYPLQAALRALLAGADLDGARKIALAKRLLAGLPASNWLRKNPHLRDHLGEDAALYDLLLHARDRAYTVPEIAALAQSAGLAITAFIEPARYDPANYLGDGELAGRAAALPWLEQAALAENLAGSMKAHVFYAVAASRAADAVATPDRPGVVPLWRAGQAAGMEKLGASLKVDFAGVAMRFALPEGAATMAGLIDGKRTLGEIAAALKLDWPAFQPRFQQFYAAFNGLNLLLLRNA
jgi:SAM-dependent methyltransferase